MLAKLVLLLVPLVFSMHCGGDFTEIQEGPRSERHLISRASTLSPIRLKYYYYNFTLYNTTLETQFKEVLIKLVDSFFTRTLRVYPITGNLTLSSTTCQSSVKVPSEHQTLGVPDTDVIVYITSNNLSSVSYVAYAGSCELDTYGLGNVVAGSVVINVPNFSDNSMEDWLANMAHEMTHMLGFSSGLIKYWRNSSGQVYASGTATKNVTVRGTTKTLVVTPTVLEKAKIAFACDTLEGLELEEYGSGGAHWDKRIMMNDYMTGYIPTDGIFSNITLALFKDTGWYEVDYSLAQMPYFAKNIGCDFFDKNCIENQTSTNSSIWCTNKTSWGCDYFALNKGGCGVKNYTSSIPKAFQYFESTVLGGTDGYMDYCPYNNPLTNGNCRGGYVSTFTFTNSKEVIGQNSRCFESTLMLKPASTSAPIYAACYEVLDCNSTAVTIKIHNTTVVCPFNGTQITLTGFNGWFRCPKNNMVCQDIPCKNFCYARGTCSARGECNCFPGFGGYSCNVTCSSNCKECSLTSKCTSCMSGYQYFTDRCCPSKCLSCNSTSFCDTCEDGFEISSQGTCDACFKGYFMSSGSCVRCSDNCIDCDSSSNCTECIEGDKVTNGYCTLECPDNCNQCTSSILCLECSFGYSQDYLGGCSCKSGFYLSSETCVKCNSECLICYKSDNCTACSNGFGLSGAACLACNSLCTKCISPEQCTECKIGNFLSGTSCIKCPSTCISCFSSSNCDSCITGYSLSGNNCLPCQIGCFSCSSPLLCTVCLKGFFLNGNECTQCSSNCLECNSLSDCLNCLTGYKIDFGYCSLICPDNCDFCSSGQFCLTCKVGFSPDTLGNCNCLSGFYLNQGACTVCNSECLLCVSAASCTACMPGYGLLVDKCILCSSLCTRCLTPTLCTQCKTGNFLSGTTCNVCPSGCSVCVSATQCSKCITGYTLINNICAICDTGCSKCSSTSVCSGCYTGYYLSVSKCLACNSTCTSCTDLYTCKGCASGYFLSISNCLACGSNCLSCTSQSSCTSCAKGYYLNSGVCANCKTGCSACTDSTYCTGCSTGYMFNSNSCIQCILGCNKCSTSTTCTTCAGKYYLYLKKCLACSSNCLSCTSSSLCTQCETGFSLLSNYCS